MEKTKRTSRAGQRTWHAGKAKKKPDYDKNAITEELLEAVVAAYEKVDESGLHPSLQFITNQLSA